MQRARAFFYVSLGILALAVAFHLGATSAHSQTGSGRQLTALAFADNQSCSGLYAVDSQGTFYTYCGPSTWRATGQLPGPIAAIANYQDGRSYWIGLANGDIYTVDNEAHFTFHSNVFASPVPTERETWGRIKADRR
jgi:hypothetical protein